MQETLHALGDLVPRRPARPRAYLQPERDVVEDSHVPEQGIVLKHHSDLALGDRERLRLRIIEQHA
ncbi:MAG: hypothetical protein ACJ8A0_23230, partial [Microvirga sp.]